MIRNAYIDDIPKLVDLKTKVGKSTYFDYGTEDQFNEWSSASCTPKYFENLINNHTTILVAEYEDVFLGMASVTFFDNYALFGNLYVGLQDRGIGSLLTKHRFSLVNSHVSLMVSSSSYEVEARVFYQNYRAYRHLLKHGFIPIDWRKQEHYDFPLVIMRSTIEVPQHVYH